MLRRGSIVTVDRRSRAWVVFIIRLTTVYRVL